MADAYTVVTPSLFYYCDMFVTQYRTKFRMKGQRRQVILLLLYLAVVLWNNWFKNRILPSFTSTILMIIVLYTHYKTDLISIMNHLLLLMYIYVVNGMKILRTNIQSPISPKQNRATSVLKYQGSKPNKYISTMVVLTKCKLLHYSLS